MGSLRKGIGSEIEDKVSIKVFEPSDKSPACDAEITLSSSAMRRGSARKLILAKSAHLAEDRSAPLLEVDLDEGNLSEADCCDVKIDIVKKTLEDG